MSEWGCPLGSGHPASIYLFKVVEIEQLETLGQCGVKSGVFIAKFEHCAGVSILDFKQLTDKKNLTS